MSIIWSANIKFRNFVEALDFTNRVGGLAEKAATIPIFIWRGAK